MKAGWEVRPLGEVCDVLDSQRKPITKRDRQPGPYPYFGATGELDRVAGYIFDESLVLLGEDGAKWGAGERSAFPVSGKVWVNNHAHVIRPIRSRLDDHWLIYFLNFSDLSEFITGLTVPKLNQGRMREIPIPLPPLDEQKRIVAVLDEAFEGLSRARANAEANLADAQALALNNIRNLFAECARLHPLRRIGDIAEHCLGKMLDKNKNQGTLRPYLRNINVRWFEVNTSDMLDMRIEDREVERYSAKKGDLLICEGGYPGRAAVWDQDEPVFFQKALHRVRFSNPTYATFLMYFLFVQDATGQLREHFTGSGIQHFTGQALAQFKLPFPDLGAAREIVGRIEEVNATTSALDRHYQTTISQLDTLRQSLLQKAFTGELT